jgi:transposase-like protein
MDLHNQIKSLFKQLPSKDQLGLLDELESIRTADSIIHIEDKALPCPYCGSDKIIKHSKYKNRQRYKCKTCSRTFSSTTGTLIHHLKKPDKFGQYASIIEKEGLLTIAKMAKRLDISIPTSFDWRHKILLSLPEEKFKFSGETQMDDLWFLYSQKGRNGLKYARKRGGSSRKGDNGFQVKIMAASDKHHVEMKLAKIGRISKNDIICAVGDKFKKDTKLVTDAHHSFSSFAKVAGLEHVNFTSKKHKAVTGENVQYINNMAERLKTLINRGMRGVSTKYLQAYVSYFAYKEKNEINVREHLKNKKVWDVFTNIEKMYAKFIENKSVRTYRCPTKRNWKSQNWNGVVVEQYSFL